MKRKTIFIGFLLIYFFASLLYAMKITAKAKIEGRIIFLSSTPIPDERNVPQDLKVPFVAKIKVNKILPDKENYDEYEIKHYLDKIIPIARITFRDISLQDKLKKEDIIIGYLHLDSFEYHRQGYQTTFSLEITGQKKSWEFWK